MDETSICMFQGSARGNVFLKRGHKVTQNISLATKRKCLTHVAFICDDVDVQKDMPQFVIMNEHTVTAAAFATLRAARPKNVHLFREKSAWVNGHLCARIVHLLANALKAHGDKFQLVLLFDTFKGHLCAHVWRALSKTRIWPLVVPAKLTWLLQPCDTHAFAVFKLCLQKAYQNERIKTVDGQAGIQALLASLYVAIHDVLETKTWKDAFDRNGFSDQQVLVSPKILALIGVAPPLAIPSLRPDVAQLKSCFPHRSKIPTKSLWRSVDLVTAAIDMPLAAGGSAASASSSSSSSSAAVAPAPIASRTRAKFSAAVLAKATTIVK
jgi:hypothetical protein